MILRFYILVPTFYSAFPFSMSFSLRNFYSLLYASFLIYYTPKRILQQPGGRFNLNSEYFYLRKTVRYGPHSQTQRCTETTHHLAAAKINLLISLVLCSNLLECQYLLLTRELKSTSLRSAKTVHFVCFKYHDFVTYFLRFGEGVAN